MKYAAPFRASSLSSETLLALKRVKTIAETLVVIGIVGLKSETLLALKRVKT